MPYDKTIEVPKIEIGAHGDCNFTHNHASSYKYLYKSNTPTTEERKRAHTFFEQGKREIKRCMAFAKEALKDVQFQAVQRATLESHIANDQALIDSINEVEPSSCNLL